MEEPTPTSAWQPPSLTDCRRWWRGLLRPPIERLKTALGETVDVGKERYGMTWPGKADCFRVIQAPSLGTLRPCPDESVNFDATGNLIIEGDNLFAIASAGAQPLGGSASDGPAKRQIAA